MPRSHASLAALVALLAAAALACSSTSKPSSSARDAGPAWAPDGPDTDTWGSWAQGFFTTYCVECHAASDPKGLDFTQHSLVVASASTIRCGVAVQQDPSWGCPANLPAGQFPISDSSGHNPKPGAADRDRVVAWIAAGSP